MSSYLSDGILVYLDHLVDWDTYFHARKGPDADVEAERAALRAVLETCAEICAEIEPEARQGWETPAKLVDGEVMLPQSLKDSLAAYYDAGWDNLYRPAELGGVAATMSLRWAAQEMLVGANPSAYLFIGTRRIRIRRIPRSFRTTTTLSARISAHSLFPRTGTAVRSISRSMGPGRRCTCG